MKPSLAVLITYHDEQHLLTRCLESLMTQAQRPDEIWIYDDASANPATRFVPPESRARVIRGEENRGPAYGRNRLLEATSCSVVHFHDADDWFFSDWSHVVATALTSEIDVLFTEVSSFVDGRLTAANTIGLTGAIATNDHLTRFAIRHALLVPSGTYRRELVLSVGGYRESIWQSEDWDYHVRIALARPRFAVIPRSVVGIDIRGASRSQRRTEVWSSQLDAIALLEREVPPGFHSDLAEAAARASGELYRLGMHVEAARGFQLASRLGQPTFDGRPAIYRVMAGLVSPLFAERVAGAYRRFFPERLRTIVRRAHATVSA